MSSDVQWHKINYTCPSKALSSFTTLHCSSGPQILQWWAPLSPQYPKENGTANAKTLGFLACLLPPACLSSLSSFKPSLPGFFSSARKYAQAYLILKAECGGNSWAISCRSPVFLLPFIIKPVGRAGHMYCTSLPSLSFLSCSRSLQSVPSSIPSTAPFTEAVPGRDASDLSVSQGNGLLLFYFLVAFVTADKLPSLLLFVTYPLTSPYSPLLLLFFFGPILTEPTLTYPLTLITAFNRYANND